MPQLNSYPQTRFLPHSPLPLRLLFTTSVTFYSSQHSLIRLQLPAAAGLLRSHLGCPCEIMHVLASADHWVHLAPHPDPRSASSVLRFSVMYYYLAKTFLVLKVNGSPSRWTFLDLDGSMTEIFGSWIRRRFIYLPVNFAFLLFLPSLSPLFF